MQGAQPHDSGVQRRELQSLNTTPGRHNSQKRARHKGGDLDVVDVVDIVLTLLMMVILTLLTMVILTLLKLSVLTLLTMVILTLLIMLISTLLILLISRLPQKILHICQRKS